MAIYRPANLIYIHIPKTGGMSLESYFCNKYQVEKSKESWIEGNAFAHSIRHMSYSEILETLKQLGKEPENFKFIASVRNPYHRLISELFYICAITPQSTQEDVERMIKQYLRDGFAKFKYINNSSGYDTHKFPQFHFLNYNDELVPNISIIRTETLEEDMKKLGYDDFIGYNSNYTYRLEENYDYYLNNNSKSLIYEYYKVDFEKLGYKHEHVKKHYTQLPKVKFNFRIQKTK